METYRVQKVQKNNTYVVVRLRDSKSILINGNLPLLYPHMFISLELSPYNEVKDFKLNVENRNNTKILTDNDVDIDEYKTTLSRFTELSVKGYSWQVAEMSDDNLYEKLSFKDADEIHRKIVNNPKDEKRIKGINKNVIKMARQRRKIAYGIEEYLSMFNEVERNGAYAKLAYCVKMLGIMGPEFSFNNNSIHDIELLNIEENVKKIIKHHKYNAYQLLNHKEIEDYLISSDSLDEDQKKAIWCLESSEPCIITGGAGVGKTTVVDSIIKCYCTYYNKGDILLVAPTGKASRRLAEKTGMPASTIHMSLRKSPEDDFVFYKKSNPLPHKLIIVDESSMIDTELMNDLLLAVSDGTKLIFVGDHNQLYPVGYGEPFFDFLSILTVYHLTINHRQDSDSDILEVADNVLKGREPKNGRGVIIRHIKESEISDFVNNDSNTQILSPYNEINSHINEMYKKGDKPFNRGDKVILLKNRKEYCNGDIGYITAVLPDEYVVNIDGKQISVAKKYESDLSLAYAITVHKMQGSESKKIVLFIPENDSFVDRRMMYTAVTRAQKVLEINYYKSGA